MPIVIVDDNPQLVEFAALLLREHGFEVYSFFHPHDALRYLRKSQLTPSILIADYDIPDMNGYELHRRLCATVPRLQTLIVSALNVRGDVSELSFLQKPFTPDDLMMKVRGLQLLAVQQRANDHLTGCRR